MRKILDEMENEFINDLANNLREVSTVIPHNAREDQRLQKQAQQQIQNTLIEYHKNITTAAQLFLKLDPSNEMNDFFTNFQQTIKDITLQNQDLQNENITEEEAIERFRSVVEKQQQFFFNQKNDDFERFHKIAIAEYEHQNYENAVKMFSFITSIFPTYSAGWIALASSTWALYGDIQARPLYDKLVEIMPHPEIYLYAADFYVHTNDKATAKTVLEKGIMLCKQEDEYASLIQPLQDLLNTI